MTWKVPVLSCFHFFLLRYKLMLQFSSLTYFFLSLSLLKQLHSVNPFGMGDSPALFDKNLKTFLSGLDKVTRLTFLFYIHPPPSFNRLHTSPLPPHSIDYTHCPPSPPFPIPVYRRGTHPLHLHFYMAKVAHPATECWYWCM